MTTSVKRSERKPKTAWLFFTHNHRIGEADQKRFKEKTIFHIPEDELSYYEKLVKHLGQSPSISYLADYSRTKTSQNWTHAYQLCVQRQLVMSCTHS